MMFMEFNASASFGPIPLSLETGRSLRTSSNILFFNNHQPIRFFQTTSQLGKEFIGSHSDRTGQISLSRIWLFYRLSNMKGELREEEIRWYRDRPRPRCNFYQRSKFFKNRKRFGQRFRYTLNGSPRQELTGRQRLLLPGLTFLLESQRPRLVGGLRYYTSRKRTTHRCGFSPKCRVIPLLNRNKKASISIWRMSRSIFLFRDVGFRIADLIPESDLTSPSAQILAFSCRFDGGNRNR